MLGSTRGGVLIALAGVTAICCAACSDRGANDSSVDLDSALVIDVTGIERQIDQRLFGTNVAAWVGPETLADPRFRNGAVDTGTTLVRLPGGSWSNWYDWLGCERRQEERCHWLWAARPTDFVDFLDATGLPGSWTVNVNETAQAAAAAVAFFNGGAGDARSIGIDRNGVDWGTVGQWARLRVDNGHPQPADIALWEVGNEVYGASRDAGGPSCPSFGWEQVWTCDGTTYVVGSDDHDGYLAIREAMIAVDPEIEVGAVGVAPPSEWNGFGTQVIDAAGDALDFYVIHSYGFDHSPSGDEAIRRPEQLWPGLIADVRQQLDPDIPIAVTEYNLVAFEAGDTEKAMMKAMNALYIADTLGQLAVAGVEIGNQWLYASGLTNSGTDYGLVNLDTYAPYPQWEAVNAWSHAGSALLSPSTDGDLHVYPTLHDDRRLTIIVINLADKSMSRPVVIEGASGSYHGTLHTVYTDDLEATEMIRLPAAAFATIDELAEMSFPAWSISRLEIERSP